MTPSLQTGHATNSDIPMTETPTPGLQWTRPPPQHDRQPFNPPLPPDYIFPPATPPSQSRQSTPPLCPPSQPPSLGKGALL
eukprot:941812-Rhodomonas_salina.1